MKSSILTAPYSLACDTGTMVRTGYWQEGGEWLANNPELVPVVREWLALDTRAMFGQTHFVPLP